MEKGMVQTIKEAVITAISKNFSQKIYAEEVPQKGSHACFGVTVKKVGALSGPQGVKHKPMIQKT